MSKTQWYIGAPNGVVLCVNGQGGGQLRGELYHSYSEEATPFGTVEEMILRMETLYDKLQFPYPGNSERSFAEPKKMQWRRAEMEKIMSDDKLLQKHGDIGTFIVRVQHRQNSSWQGRITWMENDQTIQFRSIWEMIKLIESAVDTVSTPDDDEAEPSWTVEKQE